MKILLSFNWDFFSNKSSIFVISNFCAKVLVALVQLYAIYVFTKVHTQSDAAIIFLLSGYAIWFQIFEFGLAQTLQNKFNTRQIYFYDVLKTILAHYLFLLIVGAFFIRNPFIASLFLPVSTYEHDAIDSIFLAFSIGASILILSSANVLMQRFLLIINRGVLGNFLIIAQAILVMLFLFMYQLLQIQNLIIAVIAYFGPQVFVFFPLLIKLAVKLKVGQPSHNSVKLIRIYFDSIGFCGIAILSAIFLGSDYYFVAHYLHGEDITSYYFVTRIFFISFVVYYAYLIHRIKRISFLDIESNLADIKKIYKDSVRVGFSIVFIIFLIAAILNFFGLFQLILNQSNVSAGLILVGFLYYLIRVIRDVGVVLMSSLNQKQLLYKIHFIEIGSVLVLMYILAPSLGGVGIFLSMIGACFVGLLFLIYKIRF